MTFWAAEAGGHDFSFIESSPPRYPSNSQGDIFIRYITKRCVCVFLLMVCRSFISLKLLVRLFVRIGV